MVGRLLGAVQLRPRQRTPTLTESFHAGHISPAMPPADTQNAVHIHQLCLGASQAHTLHTQPVVPLRSRRVARQEHHNMWLLD